MKMNETYACGKQFEVGDRVLIHGYKGTITKISADWEEDMDTEYKGLRFQQVKVILDPSVDHIEDSLYGTATYGTFCMRFIG